MTTALTVEQRITAYQASGRPAAVRAQLVAEHRYIAVAIAQEYAKLRGERLDLDDLISDGVLGLFRAVDLFCEAKGWKFTTYASKKIWGSMLDERRVWNGTRRRFHGGRRPVVLSLDTRFDENRDSGDRVGGRTQMGHSWVEDPRGERGVESIDGQDLFAYLTQPLEPLDRFIFTLYFVADLPMREIGRTIGVCESRISQRISAAMATLRQAAGRQSSGADATAAQYPAMEAA